MASRIDRYTRAAQTGTSDLTTYNLQPTGPTSQTPRSMSAHVATQPGSPNQSMHAHHSASNTAEQGPQFSTLPPGALSGPLFPAQQARLNPSASTANVVSGQTQPTSPTSAKDGENLENLRRSTSMTVNPNTVTSPQPLGSAGPSATWPVDEPTMGISRTTSSVTLDGEPKIFPGVVSRSARRSSLRSGQLDDLAEMSAHSGHRKGDSSSVTDGRKGEENE